MQRSVFGFMLRLLAGYQGHLRIPTGDITSVLDIFDVAAFISSKGAAGPIKEFYQGTEDAERAQERAPDPGLADTASAPVPLRPQPTAFCETTLFVKFLEDRTFHPDEDGRHVFVDDCLPRVPVALHGPPAPGAAPASADALDKLPDVVLPRTAKPTRVYVTRAPHLAADLQVRCCAGRAGRAGPHEGRGKGEETRARTKGGGRERRRRGRLSKGKGLARRKVEKGGVHEGSPIARCPPSPAPEPCAGSVAPPFTSPVASP